MHPLKLLFGFFGRFLPSFTTIGYRLRSLGWRRVQFDARGQTWLVTGASGGLGAALTRAAAANGAHVYAVARSADKLEAMRANAGSIRGKIELVVADCSAMHALQSLAANIASPVDVLVNNVGVMLEHHQTTPEGLELGFATNVLGHYVLTNALLERSKLASDAAIVSISSGGMYNVPLLPDKLESEPSTHNGARAYAFHKRAQLALTAYWQRTEKDHRRYYTMHPGWVDTPGVQTSMPVFRKLLRLVLRSPPQGIDTTLWLAATRPEPAPDKIFFDRKARPAHIFAHTRNGPPPEIVAESLESRLANLPL